jgi:hypothetical protein
VYQAGCSRTLNADYASGPSSWSHTHIVQYANGKRTLITLIGESYYSHNFDEAEYNHNFDEAIYTWVDSAK